MININILYKYFYKIFER